MSECKPILEEQQNVLDGRVMFRIKCSVHGKVVTSHYSGFSQEGYHAELRKHWKQHLDAERPASVKATPTTPWERTFA